MTAYVWCMMSGDVLNLLLLCISNHNQDKGHMNAIDGMYAFGVNTYDWKIVHG
jgi:hypothetical protein